MPQKKLPWLLRKLGLSLQVACQALIISLILVLMRVSQTHKGIATVPEATAPIFDGTRFNVAALWSLSVAWTTVPSLVMIFYGAFFQGMLDQLKICQPIMELHRKQRTYLDNRMWTRSWWPPLKKRRRKKPKLGETSSTAKLTLLLDYRQFLPVEDFIRAFSNKHYVLGVCIIIRILLILAVTLSAAILSVVTVPIEYDMTVNVTSYFDTYQADGMKAPLRPAFDVSSSTLIYGAEPIAWTTFNYSFQPFQTSPNLGNGSIKARTEAYSARLDCAAVPYQQAYAAGAISVTPPDNLNASYLTINFIQEGCEIRHGFGLSTQKEQVARMFAVTNCPGPLSGRGRTRLGMLAGQYDGNALLHLANLSIISCLPSFWNTTGEVTVATSDTGGVGKILSFEPDGPDVEIFPTFRQPLLDKLPQNVIQDVDSNYDMDSMARLAFNYATIRNRDSPFDNATLITSLNVAFRAFYASFITTVAYFPTDAPTPVAATLIRAEPRLFVISAVAFPVVGILAAAMLATCWVAVYAHRNRAVLREKVDPVVLGHAQLIGVDEGTDVGKYLAAVRGDIETVHGGDVDNADVVKHARKDWRLRDWKVWLDLEGRVRVESPTGEAVASIGSTFLGRLSD